MSHSTPTVLNTSNEHKEDARCHEDSQVSSADAGHNHVGDLPNSQLSDFADALDKEARAALKAQGLAKYERVTVEEQEQAAAEKEAARMAAREVAEAMSSQDKPLEFSDDMFD